MSPKISFAKIMKYLAWSDPYYFSYPPEPEETERNPGGSNNRPDIP